ncbi:MAG: carbamate kinase [Desulfosarcinaceae bacterium]|nr:carbamate kinase [Desulfosarcinaceae bacterium]
MSPTNTTTAKPILLVALGGNALIRKGQKGSVEEQFDNLRLPLQQIAELSRTFRIIITHGNGPQVGDLLLQQECCTEDVPKLPLEILVAQTEGQIGYMIESTLDGELMERGVHTRPLVSLITYVVVDKADPGFQHPTKPIGPAFTAEQAAALPYPTMKTPKGYRRVVASPRPVTIIEKREIRKLIEMDFIVICCGGGGIPVTREDRAFLGVDAVIDKDLASARLAAEVGVEVFIIATDVPGVYTDFGGPSQALMSDLSLDRAETLAREGALGTGSMLPKVEACCQFVKHGGRTAVITDIGNITAAVAGEAGTRFRV